MAASLVFLVLVQFGAAPTDLTVNTTWPRYTNYWAANKTEINQTTPELNITEGYIRLDKKKNIIAFPITPKEKVLVLATTSIISVLIHGTPTVNLYYGPGVLIEWNQNINLKVNQRNVLLEQIPLNQICTHECYCENHQHCKYY